MATEGPGADCAPILSTQSLQAVHWLFAYPACEDKKEKATSSVAKLPGTEYYPYEAIVTEFV